MENPVWLPKLKNKFGSAVLNFRPLGTASGAAPLPCVWVEQKAVVSVAEWIKSEQSFSPTLAEDMSIFELEGSFVVTYFFRTHSGNVALRYVAAVSQPEDWIELPSLSGLWMSLQPLEARNAELWGVRFRHPDGGLLNRAEILAEGWIGFPMRKNYVFPTEFQGLPHHRPVGRTVPDEHSLGGDE